MLFNFISNIQEFRKQHSKRNCKLISKFITENPLSILAITGICSSERVLFLGVFFNLDSIRLLLRHTLMMQYSGSQTVVHVPQVVHYVVAGGTIKIIHKLHRYAYNFIQTKTIFKYKLLYIYLRKCQFVYIIQCKSHIYIFIILLIAKYILFT